MKSILITAIGGDIAQSIALVVRKAFPGWKIIGCDIHTRHGGHLLVDKFLLAPRADSDAYLDWLQETSCKLDVDLCIPASEAELDVLSGAGLRQLGRTLLIMSNSLAIRTGLDKLVTNEFLHSIGVAAPWTSDAESPGKSISYPCIFKYRRGAGSKQIFECQNAEEADFFRRKYPGGILQELLLPKDQEVTCAVFRAKDGSIHALQMLRELTGGFTGWAQVIQSPEIEDQCSRIAAGLDLNGSINIQLRITASGPRIFEINPRFSSTVLIRHLMGFQDVVWSILDTLGQSARYFIPEPGLTAVRIQGAELVREWSGFLTND